MMRIGLPVCEYALISLLSIKSEVFTLRSGNFLRR